MKYFTDTHELLISEGMREKVKLLIGSSEVLQQTKIQLPKQEWMPGLKTAEKLSKSVLN
ncbi:MAG: hypothetical protein GX799_09000 [Crenarchaeota archaeon]|nr:hypothetical protein [Thermoproteota archaeon]